MFWEWYELLAILVQLITLSKHMVLGLPVSMSFVLGGGEEFMCLISFRKIKVWGVDYASLSSTWHWVSNLQIEAIPFSHDACDVFLSL